MTKTVFGHGTAVTPEFLNAINHPVFKKAPANDGEVEPPTLNVMQDVQEAIAEAAEAAAAATTAVTAEEARARDAEAALGANLPSSAIFRTVIAPAWAHPNCSGLLSVSNAGKIINLNLSITLPTDTDTIPASNAVFYFRNTASSGAIFALWNLLLTAIPAFASVGVALNGWATPDLSLKAGASGYVGGSTFVDLLVGNFYGRLYSAPDPDNTKTQRVVCIELRTAHQALNWSSIIAAGSYATGYSQIYMGGNLASDYLTEGGALSVT